MIITSITYNIAEDQQTFPQLAHHFLNPSNLKNSKKDFVMLLENQKYLCSNDCPLSKKTRRKKKGLFKVVTLCADTGDSSYNKRFLTENPINYYTQI